MEFSFDVPSSNNLVQIKCCSYLLSLVVSNFFQVLEFSYVVVVFKLNYDFLILI